MGVVDVLSGWFGEVVVVVVMVEEGVGEEA